MYNAVFISDLHLGTSVCQEEKLFQFLKDIKTKKLYLLGDIIDVIAMKKKVHFNFTTIKIIKRVMKMAEQGVEVVYIPGNHDYVFRDLDGTDIGNVKILKKSMHETAKGEKIFLSHGDEFDGQIKNMYWLYNLGDNIYSFLVSMNKPFNRMRRFIGCKNKNFSLSMFLKNKTKNMIKIISHFENLVVEKAIQKGADSVMCGHIHTPEITKHASNGKEITYYNTGCWTEICSYIVENEDGSLELLHY